MRLISYKTNDRSGFGIAADGGVTELSGLLPGIVSVDDLLSRHGTELANVLRPFTDRDADMRLEDVVLLPPVAAPSKIICIGLNYKGHVSETGRQPNDRPTIFSRWADSHVGHAAPIVLPAASGNLDFEGELAVIIGKPGRHIRQADAMGHVAGYSCYNDGSVRDWQRHSSQFLPGKNFVASGSFGPWLVTADEVPDYRALDLTTRLNGEVMQHASLDMLIFDLPYLISYISTFTMLNPGDVIVSGTPEGVGAFRTPPVWMKAGDVVEVEISGIGTLANEIVAETGGEA